MGVGEPGRPVGRVVVEGLPSALLVAGFMLSGRGHLWWGLGLVLLTAVSTVALWRWGRSTAAGLDRERQREVRRALWRGEGVEDPRSAGPLLEAAEAALARPYHPWPYRVVFAAPAVLGVGALLLGFPDDGWRGLSAGTYAIAVSALGLGVLLPLAGRQRRRTARAAELTRRAARATSAPPDRSRTPPPPPGPGSTGPACPSSA